MLPSLDATFCRCYLLVCICYFLSSIYVVLLMHSFLWQQTTCWCYAISLQIADFNYTAAKAYSFMFFTLLNTCMLHRLLLMQVKCAVAKARQVWPHQNMQQCVCTQWLTHTEPTELTFKRQRFKCPVLPGDRNISWRFKRLPIWLV
jgi:hypothetical protein